MCGRFESLVTWAMFNDLRDGFLTTVPAFATAREIRPTNMVPVIVQGPEGNEVIEARWWLIPGFHKGAIKDWKATTFNARLEGIETKPTFRDAWKKRHCIVPAGAFFEWTGPKASRSKFRITRADNLPLTFAGIWEHANTADGPVTSFTILTRAPGPDMEPFHDREPVNLEPDAWSEWLDVSKSLDLTTAAPAGKFRISPA